MSINEPKPAPKSSWKRDVPSPWIDCDGCGWRHYVDTSQRAGPVLPKTCGRCGAQLAAPPSDQTA